MTLNVNSLLCHQSYACFDQTTEARITQFSLVHVALCLSYLPIKFDDEIKGNPFEFQTSPDSPASKLNWPLGLTLFATRFRSY